MKTTLIEVSSYAALMTLFLFIQTPSALAVDLTKAGVTVSVPETAASYAHEITSYSEKQLTQALTLLTPVAKREEFRKTLQSFSEKPLSTDAINKARKDAEICGQRPQHETGGHCYN